VSDHIVNEAIAYQALPYGINDKINQQKRTEKKQKRQWTVGLSYLK